MKARVIVDANGKVVAIERPPRGSKRFDASPGPDGMQAKLMMAPGHKAKELDLPDDFENIEDAEEFHKRLLPHLTKAP